MISLKDSIQKDLYAGKKIEVALLKKLNKLYNNSFSACAYKYHLFDMVNDDKNIYVELKSRRNGLKDFETSIIGTNKIRKSYYYHKKNIKSYFMFKFNDKKSIYYIKYEPELFSKFKTEFITRKDRDVTKLHSHIPIKLLKKLTSKSITIKENI